MAKAGHITLTCTKQNFRPVDHGQTRWWQRNDWQEYYEATDGALGWGNSPHAESDWRELYEQGDRFCATLDERGRAVAVAGLWPRSEDAWEVIAVGVREGEMSRGFGRAIVSFVTEEIIRRGRKATITTRTDNVAMVRAAQAVGFRATRQRRTTGNT